MNKLMILERAVLESIGSGNKSAQKIVDDIGMGLAWVKPVLFQLQAKGILQFDGMNYWIINQSKLNEINQADSIKYEVKEIANSMIDSYFAKNTGVGVRLQKVSMTDGEVEIFKTMLANMESFITELRSRKKTAKTSRQQVIFWGTTTYESLLGDFIRNNC